MRKRDMGCRFMKKNGRIGNELREFAEDILPEDQTLNDLKIFDVTRVSFLTNSAIETRVDFEEVCRLYSAVYISGEKEAIREFGLQEDIDGNSFIDQDTLQTKNPKVFASRKLMPGEKAVSPVMDISEGKKAAVSIDRMIQKVSLTASRSGEGAYETSLFVDLNGIKKAPAVLPARKNMGYTKEEASSEAERCMRCSCLKCVKACKYLEHYEKYPKKYVREIANNFSILVGKKTAKNMINSCNLCGLCGEICPNFLNMAEVNGIAREMAAERGDMPPAIHDFPIRDMLFSNSEKFALKKHQPGLEKSRYVFYPGCQLSALEPGYVDKIYGDLTKLLEGGVGLWLGCCGAPAKWSGRTEVFTHIMEEFYDGWRTLGKPEILLACPACRQVLKGSRPEIPVSSVWEVFSRYGLSRPATPNGIAVAVHDPCTARYETEEQDAVRDILNKLGYPVIELKYSRQKTKCCGYGGLTIYANPELTRETIRARSEESDNDYVTYCINCKDYFVSGGKRAWHILDILYGNTENGPVPVRRMGYTSRQENRIKLKEKMLRERWGEPLAAQMEDYECIRLVIQDDVMELMDKRFILAEDLQKTIHYAETTGRKVYNPENNHSIAHYKPRIITYWVEYGMEDGKYRIYNAYSHRLKIVEDGEQK